MVAGMLMISEILGNIHTQTMPKNLITSNEGGGNFVQRTFVQGSTKDKIDEIPQNVTQINIGN